MGEREGKGRGRGERRGRGRKRGGEQGGEGRGEGERPSSPWGKDEFTPERDPHWPLCLRPFTWKSQGQAQ